MKSQNETSSPYSAKQLTPNTIPIIFGKEIAIATQTCTQLITKLISERFIKLMVTILDHIITYCTIYWKIQLVLLLLFLLKKKCPQAAETISPTAYWCLQPFSIPRRENDYSKVHGCIVRITISYGQPKINLNI